MSRIQEYKNINNQSKPNNILDDLKSLSSNSQEGIEIMQSNISQNETPLSAKGNVKSFCRIRPNNTLFSCLDKFTIENNNKTLQVDFTQENDKFNPSKQNLVKYNFTEIFGTSSSNQEIFEKICKENINQFFSEHKNCLIFVYGITNSGKTYTVIGDLHSPGILQLSLNYLWKEFDSLKSNNNLWQLKCTYIEIYNEEIYDLLSKERKKLKISGTTSNKFYPQGAIIKNIKDKKDFSNILKIGEINRSKGETNSNHNSSRSHSIFRIELSYNGTDNKVLKEPISICIVDLAGAERASKSGVSGNGLKETGNINSSLLCLKKCFDAMEINSKVNCAEKKVIVPVRESKLTLLFKEYFAAHQNISVICTINPDKNEINDIRSVLNFGSHAMKVKTIKSWIQTNYCSRDISPNKNWNKDNNNQNYKDQKRFRMYTSKKYLDKNYNDSKEKDSKCKEDYSSLSVKKKINFLSSEKKIQNIKLTNKKKNELKNISKNNSIINDENDDNYIYLKERQKCISNPYQLMATNNFYVKYIPEKPKEKLEEKMKEKQQEIKDNISKKGDAIKHAFLEFLKKVYYDNLNHNIEIYETQCENIDTKEIEILLLKNKNISYTYVNPLIKTNEDKNTFSKNLKICGDNNLVYAPELDAIRTNNQIEELVQIKLNNSNEHDMTKINDYLDRSFEQYQTTKFKAYFGIGDSLIKKTEDDKKNIKKENKQEIVENFTTLNNDREMADKINYNENETIINEEMFSNEYNYKKKGKNKIKNNEKYKEQNLTKEEKDEKDDNDENVENSKNKKSINTDDEIESKKTCDIEIENNDNDKKKKKKSKKKVKSKKKKETKQNKENEKKKKNKKKKIESDSENDFDNNYLSDDNINIKSLYPKYKKGKSKRKKK